MEKALPLLKKSYRQLLHFNERQVMSPSEKSSVFSRPAQLKPFVGQIKVRPQYVHWATEKKMWHNQETIFTALPLIKKKKIYI